DQWGFNALLAGSTLSQSTLDFPCNLAPFPPAIRQPLPDRRPAPLPRPLPLGCVADFLRNPADFRKALTEPSNGRLGRLAVCRPPAPAPSPPPPPPPSSSPTLPVSTPHP